jgi:hypothetical protein
VLPPRLSPPNTFGECDLRVQLLGTAPADVTVEALQLAAHGDMLYVLSRHWPRPAVITISAISAASVAGLGVAPAGCAAASVFVHAFDVNGILRCVIRVAAASSADAMLSFALGGSRLCVFQRSGAPPAVAAIAAASAVETGETLTLSVLSLSGALLERTTVALRGGGAIATGNEVAASTAATANPFALQALLTQLGGLAAQAFGAMADFVLSYTRTDDSGAQTAMRPPSPQLPAAALMLSGERALVALQGDSALHFVPIQPVRLSAPLQLPQPPAPIDPTAPSAPPLFPAFLVEPTHPVPAAAAAGAAPSGGGSYDRDDANGGASASSGRVKVVRVPVLHQLQVSRLFVAGAAVCALDSVNDRVHLLSSPQ